MGIVNQLLTFNIEDEDGNQFFPDLTVTSADFITRLKGYAVHSDECAINGWMPRGDEPCPPCTCGLSALLEEIDYGDR